MSLNCGCSGTTVKEDAFSSFARASSTSSPSSCLIAKAGTPGCPRQYPNQCHSAVQEGMMSDLVDAAFLVSDFGQSLAEHPDVINPESRHSGRDRLRNDVGRVVRSADADLENGRVHLSARGAGVNVNSWPAGGRGCQGTHAFLKKDVHSHDGQVTEVGRLLRRDGISALVQGVAEKEITRLALVLLTLRHGQQDSSPSGLPRACPRPPKSTAQTCLPGSDLR